MKVLARKPVGAVAVSGAAITLANQDSEGMTAEESPVEQLLARVRAGDRDARADLISLAYGEMRGIARSLMSRQPHHHTLQATALVSEACIKLLKGRAPWSNHVHFLRVVAQAMRQVLVDHARAKGAARRNPGSEHEVLDRLVEGLEERSGPLEFVDEALCDLRKRSVEGAQLIELRFFGGASMEDCAQILGMSVRNAQRLWARARAQLRFHLEEME